MLTTNHQIQCLKEKKLKDLVERRPELVEVVAARVVGISLSGIMFSMLQVKTEIIFNKKMTEWLKALLLLRIMKMKHFIPR